MDPCFLLKRLIGRHDLAPDEAEGLFETFVDDRLPPPLAGALLAALASKGESATEILAAARVLRRHACPVRVPDGVHAIDTCGTGGDGQPIFNVSSAVAIVAAAAGATVAKHGNRSTARPSGSAEALAALGVNIDADVPTLETCLRRCRIAFLYAVRLHPAMRHVAPVRQALGIRTIFNLVGPLANPAGVRRQLLGVNRPELVPLMLEALRGLGAERAMVVHGREGLCDLSPAGPSLVGRWDGRQVRLEEVNPAEAGLQSGDLAALRVRNPHESAALIRSVLAGEAGPARDMVLFNAAAALWIAELAEDWRGGVRRAEEAIDSGAAAALLDEWVRVSHGA